MGMDGLGQWEGREDDTSLHFPCAICHTELAI